MCKISVKYLKLYGSQSSSTVSIFQRKKSGFSKTIELCLNFYMGFSIILEPVVPRCSVKKAYLEVSQNSQENTSFIYSVSIALVKRLPKESERSKVLKRFKSCSRLARICDGEKFWQWFRLEISTAQKMKFFIKGFFSKCDQIHRKLQIWLHLLKKSLMENFFFFCSEDLKYSCLSVIPQNNAS